MTECEQLVLRPRPDSKACSPDPPKIFYFIFIFLSLMPPLGRHSWWDTWTAISPDLDPVFLEQGGIIIV